MSAVPRSENRFIKKATTVESAKSDCPLNEAKTVESAKSLSKCSALIPDDDMLHANPLHNSVRQTSEHTRSSRDHHKKKQLTKHKTSHQVFMKSMATMGNTGKGGKLFEKHSCASHIFQSKQTSSVRSRAAGATFAMELDTKMHHKVNQLRVRRRSRKRRIQHAHLKDVRVPDHFHNP